jgi:tetratricopeptide (TPR) repeat protein
MKILLLILVLFSFQIYGQLNINQKKTIDSLKLVIKNAKHDTILINAWTQWDNLIYVSDPDLDLKLLEKIEALSSKRLKGKLSNKEKKYFENSRFFAWNGLGISFMYLGEYENALKYFEKGLKFKEEEHDKKGISFCLNNIGLIYYNQGNFSKAIDFYMRSLKIKEELGDKKGISSSLSNIGLIYENQNDYTKAINFYERSLKYDEETGNKNGLASSLNNIGMVYCNQQNLSKALEYYNRSLKIRLEIGDKNGIAGSLNNIGDVYEYKSNYSKAMDNYMKCLKLREELGELKGISNVLRAISNLYYKQKNYTKSITFATRALKIAKEINAIDQQMKAFESLWKSYKSIGQFQKSLEMHEFYIQTKESFESEENQKEVISQEFKYLYEKEKAADSITNAKEKEIKNAEIFRQKAELEIQNTEIKAKKNQQYALFGGLLLVIVFSIFMYKRYRLTQKQKMVIEEKEKETLHQKEVIEEKHKEITDSITYAKRIQSAILPSFNLIQSVLPESFVIYKPKDIVAGDFYWLEVVEDTVLFAAADCTGHGVPGAMVSVVCNNGLNRAVREDKLYSPDLILNKTRELVVKEFEKSDENVMDGMDISLCAWNTLTNQLKWAGAHNPLWILRNNEIIEFKADKQPIGKYAYVKSFTLHEIQLEKCDIIYIFTDGYQDQFGGPNEKKFRASQMKELFLSISEKSMEEQSKIIEQAFEVWKGRLEQVDDVCVIGVRI